MKDLLTGLVVGAFSAGYLVMCADIKIFGGATAGVTAQTVPRLWGACLLALSVLLLLRGIRDVIKRRGQEAGACGRVTERIKERREVVYTFALLILYAVLMKPLGFILSSMLYVYLQVWALTPVEKRTRRMHCIGGMLSVFFSASLYFLFTKYLMVMLPPGILK